MTRFYVGQPVVCVNDKVSLRVLALYPNLTWPVRGQKYHVRENVPLIANSVTYPAILVREIRNRVVVYMDGTNYEAGFAEFRFEPITENQVQSIIAIATDVPDEITTRELEDV